MCNKIKILFLTDDREDYLSDGVLHGLRHISRLEVIDYPRKECLYQSGERAKFSVRGGGFTLYGLLANGESIGRDFIQQKLEQQWFDLVIISNIWRQWGLLIQWEKLLKNQRLIAVLDGDDDNRFYPSSGTRIRQFGIRPMLNELLNAKGTIYFKREWTEETKQWPYRSKINPLSFSIPKVKIVSNICNKRHDFPSHIVDQDLCKELGAKSSYAFSSEVQYRQNLAESRFGITTKRGGWECLRHYEIAASGTIPCFKRLSKKPATCAPFGLIDGVNCIDYENTNDLMSRIKNLSEDEENEMRTRALNWANHSTTTERAKELLKAMSINVDELDE